MPGRIPADPKSAKTSEPEHRLVTDSIRLSGLYHAGPAAGPAAAPHALAPALLRIAPTIGGNLRKTQKIWGRDRLAAVFFTFYTFIPSKYVINFGTSWEVVIFSI